MSAENFETCRKCGGTMIRVSLEKESPLIVECQSCNHREFAAIEVFPSWPIDKRSVEYSRVVVCRAEVKAKAEEIRALRELCEEFRELPVGEAAKRIGSSKFIDLGVCIL